MSEQLPVSDVTPYVPIAPALDWDSFNRELDRLGAKIGALRPIVKRHDGFFVLYQCKEMIVKAASAQSILDYCNAMFPKGTKIQWIILGGSLA